MKTSDIYSCISIVLLFIIAFHQPLVSLAQDQNAIPVKQKDNDTFNLPAHFLTLTLFDTVRPALRNCGEGLLHYDCIFLKHQDKTYLFKNPGEAPPFMVISTFTDLDLEIMKQNLLYINKQNQVLINEWIRKQKIDLNLGEAIRGFYMNPIY